MSSLDVSDLEYDAITEACGLLDRSERGKLALTGGRGQELPPGPGVQRRRGAGTRQRLLRGVSDPEGQDARRPADPRHRGGAAARHRARGAPGAVQHDPPLQHRLRRRAAQAHARARAAVAARPRAPTPSAGSTRAPRSTPTSPARSAGSPVRAIRTDLGIDLLLRRRRHRARSPPRSSRPAPTPVSEAAADVVRVEHGRPRYGIDLDDTVIPQEADLNARAVSFTKGCYVGQETVARLYYRGKPNRQLRGLRLSAPACDGRRDHLRRPDRRAAGQRRRVAGAGPDRAGAGPPRGASRLTRERRLRRDQGGRRRAPLRALTRASTKRSAARVAVGRPAAQRQLGRLRMRGQPAADDPHLVDLVRRHVGAELADPPGARQRGGGAGLELAEVVVQRAPVDQPAAGEPEAVELGAGRMRGQHQPRAGVGGLEHAVQPARGRRAAGPRGAAARRRARTAARAAAARIWRLDVVQQRRARSGCRSVADEQAAAPRRAGGGTGSGPDRRGTATGSGPSARRRRDDRGAAAAGRSGAARTASRAARPAPAPAAGPAAARS